MTKYSKVTPLFKKGQILHIQLQTYFIINNILYTIQDMNMTTMYHWKIIASLTPAALYQVHNYQTYY
jgi:hypothetical protein